MRVAIFIDGNNFYHMQKSLGWAVDVEKLLGLWAAPYRVVDARYFAATDDDGDSSFLKAIVHRGCSLVKKRVKSVAEATWKGNLDVEIALDMVLTSDSFDMAVLVSGDGDFLKPLDYLRSKGKVVKVIATESCLAWELREFVGKNFIELATLEKSIRNCNRFSSAPEGQVKGSASDKVNVDP